VPAILALTVDNDLAVKMDGAFALANLIAGQSRDVKEGERLGRKRRRRENLLELDPALLANGLPRSQTLLVPVHPKAAASSSASEELSNPN
jgi:hypothetical protein